MVITVSLVNICHFTALFFVCDENFYICSTATFRCTVELPTATTVSMTFVPLVHLHPLPPNPPSPSNFQHFVSFVFFIPPCFFFNSKLQISSGLGDLSYQVPSQWCRQRDWECSQREKEKGGRQPWGGFLTSSSSAGRSPCQDAAGLRR